MRGQREIWIGDDLVNDMAPHDCDIAMVFQNSSQLPTMLASVIREEMAVDLDDVEMEPAEGAF